VNLETRIIPFLAGLVISSLVFSPARANLSITGGITDESTQTGMPAYADSRFYPRLEAHGFPGPVDHRAGLTYSHQEGSGIFLDLCRTYEFTPDISSSRPGGETGAQLRKRGEGFSIGAFTRFLSRGRFFINVSYMDVTRHLDPSTGGIQETDKPKTKSTMGVSFPLTRRSSINLIGNFMGNGSPGLRGGDITGLLSGRFVFDALVGTKAGPFSMVFGITNLLDRRDSDPLLDSNGSHYNPGRNVFVQFTSRF
jgi:hypothetical protein